MTTAINHGDTNDSNHTGQSDSTQTTRSVIYLQCCKSVINYYPKIND